VIRVDAAAPRGLAELREAARAFESLFAKRLLAAMRATVKPSRLFHGGRGEDLFRDLLDRGFAEGAARAGAGLGFARLLVERYRRNVTPS
jgi:Rod binding domain-containing protein